MFNLLRRRSKHRKSHKNKNYETNTSGDDDDAEGGGTSASPIARNFKAMHRAREQEQERAREQMPKQESYRKFSEEEASVVREHCRATVLPYRRAVIDELEDFVDEEEAEANEQNDDNRDDNRDENGDDEERTTTDSDMFYFEQLRQRQQKQQQQRQVQPEQRLTLSQAAGAGSKSNVQKKEYEKVKLAKTAAKLSGDGAITRTDSNRQTNSANANANELSKSIVDVDDNNRNKISKSTTVGGLAGATIESRQSQAAASTLSVASDASVASDLSLANTVRSQNEEAKWQGHIDRQNDHNDHGIDEVAAVVSAAAAAATFGTKQKLIGKIIKTSQRNDQINDNNNEKNNKNNNNEYNNNKSSSSNSRISKGSSENSERPTTAIKQFNSSSPIRLSGSKQNSCIESQVENAEKSVVVNNSHSNSDSNDNGINKTRATREIAQRSGNDAVETVISQVKYRNLNGSREKTRQNETKRQSRLSLTNFGFGKATLATPTTTTNHNQQHESNACIKEKAKQQQQKPQTTTTKTTTNFFGIHRKNPKEQKSHNTEKSRGVEVATAAAATTSKKSLVKPLQKSCEFLSDIFMARGRNHNRNRNNHNTNANHTNTHHQHQQQQQHQQPSKQSTKTIYQSSPSVGVEAAAQSPPSLLLGTLAPQTLQMTIENDILMDDDIDDDNDDQRVVAHLETNSDPAACLSATNSYQMTESNNSSNKNFYLTQKIHTAEQEMSDEDEEVEEEEDEEDDENENEESQQEKIEAQQQNERVMNESERANESNSADEESADQNNITEDDQDDDDDGDDDDDESDNDVEMAGVTESVSASIEIEASESIDDDDDVGAVAATEDEDGNSSDDDDVDVDVEDDVVVLGEQAKQANATEFDFIHAANVDQQGVQQLESAAEQRQRDIVRIERQAGDGEEDGGDDTEIVLPKVRQQHQTNIDGDVDVDLMQCEQQLIQQQQQNNNNNNNYNSDNNNNNNSKEQSNCISVNKSDQVEACDITSMGQSHPNGRTETNGVAANGSRASTPREFRESVITEQEREFERTRATTSSPPVVLPKITVVDYSDNAQRATLDGAANEQSPKEQEIFYDFDTQQQQQSPKSHSIDIVSIEDDEDEDDDDDIDKAVAVQEVDDDDEVFEMDIPTTVYQQHQHQQQQQQQQRWTRLSHVKLENVPEQEEEEEEDEEEDDEDEGKGSNDYDDDGDGDDDNLDHEHELYKRQMRSTSSDKRESTERTGRSPLKSTNTSDSNLSTSYPDSGIGIDLSQQSYASMAASEMPTKSAAAAASAQSIAGIRNMATLQARSPFVRDGNSTDCDETLMQCDELNDDDNFLHTTTNTTATTTSKTNERLVCIESISLPDVVVESTTASNASSCGNVNGATTHSSSSLSSSSAAASSSSQGEQIININGATGNSVGNVHFIPIHIEGGRGASRSRSRSGSPKQQQQQQQRSFDDSCIGSKRSYAQLNGHQMPPTIEIIEDESVLNTDTKPYTDYEKDLLKQELNEQKAHYALQIEDAQKNVNKLEHKVVEMQTKIEKMEQELSLKTWNVERLQGELSAAQKDDEFVRQKLKRLEEEKTNLRHKYCDDEEDAKRKYTELESQYQELDEKYKQTQCLASNLQTQLVAAQAEAEKWRTEVEKIRADLEEQLRILKNALDNSEAERKICEDKWQKEFEMLRTHNMEREETLMTDCEWQLRQMQRQWKDKCDKATHDRKDAQHKADELQEELEQRNEEVENLRVYEAQVNSLRGVVNEQEHSIESLMLRIESLTTELATTKENLELQIEAVAKIKYQCDNALYDKERQMIYRIDEVRNEAAAFWEDKLYTEMTRLKNELESVYVDERRDALDKLQVEHIEELRALTTRYTANEDELRAELEELQERLDKKSEEYLQLREKSDNSLLQTRMHLDRADRDFQAAMCREEERRELLEQKLHKEFEDEKLEMEEKFRERLGQVKEEFAKELQLSTQDLVDEQRLELEKQKAKLISEKDQALQELADRHRNKLAAVEENIKDIELRHKRDMKDLKAAYDAEKAALDKRDISNANEIEMLHRKCRCLTNLFEEMRMRYERRDPRPEDLREISELRGRCESQERDLYVLTDRLREMQIQMTELQQNGKNAGSVGKAIKKPPPKTIPTSCDVIYEDENEERESPPPPPSSQSTNTNNYRQQQRKQQKHEEQQEDEANDENDENVEDAEEEKEEEEASDTESNHKIEINGKNIDTINEDDAHMITAV